MKKALAKRPGKITLRQLKQTEISSIYPLIRMHNPNITQKRFNECLAEMLPYGYYAVAAFDGDEMVAVSGFWLRSRFWCGRQLDIDNFFVHPDYRRAGLGKKLVDWLEKRAIKEKCELIVLDAYADGFLAHRFYHRQGFVAMGTHFTKVPGTDAPWNIREKTGRSY